MRMLLIFCFLGFLNSIFGQAGLFADGASTSNGDYDVFPFALLFHEDDFEDSTFVSFPCDGAILIETDSEMKIVQIEDILFAYHDFAEVDEEINLIYSGFFDVKLKNTDLTHITLTLGCISNNEFSPLKICNKEFEQFFTRDFLDDNGCEPSQRFIIKSKEVIENRESREELRLINYKLELYSASGQRVAYGTEYIKSEFGSFIDKSNIPSGIYFLVSIDNNGVRDIRKIFK